MFDIRAMVKGFIPAAATLLVAAFSVIGTGSANASEPIVTSDIVLVMEDSYDLADTATLALRNDGDVRTSTINTGRRASSATRTLPDAASRSRRRPL
jgi:hypothetical protein